VRERLDVITGSFGAALGGGGGGFVAGRATLIGWLRQKSRPYLASTALAPAAAAAACKAIELAPSARPALDENLRAFQSAMRAHAGIDVDVTHPAVSVLVKSAIVTQRLVDALARLGLFVVGYCHPVVPEGQARVSVRVTGRHAKEDLERVARGIAEGMKAV
jgi:glycine C-acetyltransferase